MNWAKHRSDLKHTTQKQTALTSMDFFRPPLTIIQTTADRDPQHFCLFCFLHIFIIFATQ